MALIDHKKTGRAFLMAIGTLVGLPIGGLLGFYLTFFGCVLLAPVAPGLAQVGWISCFATIPGGACIGAVLGCFGIVKRPCMFALVVVPVITFQTTHYVLREKIDMPRSYALKITGAPGESFVGAIRVDGELHAVKGTFPAEFHFEALQIEFGFAAVERKEGEKISVEVVIDGVTRRTSDSPIGIHEQYSSFGYAEWVGGTSSSGGGSISPEDADLLITRNTMPPKGPGGDIGHRPRRNAP